jgi:hypothetical protein
MVAHSMGSDLLGIESSYVRWMHATCRIRQFEHVHLHHTTNTPRTSQQSTDSKSCQQCLFISSRHHMYTRESGCSDQQIPVLLYWETRLSPCPCRSTLIQYWLALACTFAIADMLHSLDSELPELRGLRCCPGYPISYAQRPCRRNAILYLYIMTHLRLLFLLYIQTSTCASLKRENLVRDLAVIDCLGQWLDKLAGRTEDLQLVVLGGTHHQPGVVLVPVKVADAVGEATVHEQAEDLLVNCNKN